MQIIAYAKLTWQKSKYYIIGTSNYQYTVYSVYYTVYLLIVIQTVKHVRNIYLGSNDSTVVDNYKLE